MLADDDDKGWGIAREMYDNLAKIGAISLQQYLYGVTTSGSENIGPSSSPVPSTSTARPAESTHLNAIARLNQACQRAFGNTDTLKYEFIEENGQKSTPRYDSTLRHTHCYQASNAY